MWLGSDPGAALAQSSEVPAQDEPLGVTKGSADTVASGGQVLAAGSPLRAIKRFGNSQRNLLNRVNKAARQGQKSKRARRVVRRPYRRTSAHKVSRAEGSGQGIGQSMDGATLQGLGRHEYLRLLSSLSGQGCESVEGGVIVRRGC